MDQMKASNATFLDESTGGKGKYFRARILQAGLVKYSFGVCLLEKETIDKFIYEFIGCPVIIDHKDVTEENAKEERVGVISRVWFDQMDGWFWVEGVIFDEKAISLINDGYNVSCQYEISEYANNVTDKLHNGNKYDKVILNGKPEHLAIVKNPRYENAMIAVNALEIVEEEGEEIIVEISKEEVIKSFNNGIIQAINEIKETDMFKNLFKKKENNMDKDELKSLFMECLSELTASNSKEEEKEEKIEEKIEEKEEKVEDKAENSEDEEKEDEKEDVENKAKNEVVDKRDIIRQIMAIAGKHEDNEDVRTIAKLAEKLAYEKSEADKKADNKCKNEEKEEEKEDKKASNSILEGQMAAGKVEFVSVDYNSRKSAIELGNELF